MPLENWWLPGNSNVKVPENRLTTSDCNESLTLYGFPLVLGYIPLKSLTGSKAEIDKRIAELNQYHGADKAQIAAMEAGSLFGWHIPAANPNMYDENSLPRRRKKGESPR